MFIRKKKNKSGTVSVQIIDKSSGKYKVLKTIGSSGDKRTIEIFLVKAQQEIIFLTGQEQFNFDIDREKQLVDAFFNSIEDLRLLGPELLLGRLFDEIGYNKIDDELFKYLVITRLIYPVSKLKTIDYLYKYKGVSISIDKVYRYLDRLHKEQTTLVEEISYRHAVKTITSNLSVVFYDVTTLYFESEDEDDLRKSGFSKDGKHQNPQILLGLLVNASGFPLGYEIFDGKKFEGHTMLPVIEAFKRKYKLRNLVIVADAGLMSKKNIRELKQSNYKFIIGAKIKNESEALKKEILSLNLSDGQSKIIQKEEDRLIISYSLSRAKKDEHNRKRGLKKLEKSIRTGKLTKKQITNRGYNKYLKVDGKASVLIDYEKYKDDSKWNGLKGYLTNTKLSKQEVLAQYKQLWKIEKTFRISKTDLRIRPIYHYLRKRIESHICISFAACVIYKELERQLKLKKSNLSPEKAINILKTIYAITMTTPYSKTNHTRLLIKNKEQEELLRMFEIPF